MAESIHARLQDDFAVRDAQLLRFAEGESRKLQRGLSIIRRDVSAATRLMNPTGAKRRDTQERRAETLAGLYIGSILLQGFIGSAPAIPRQAAFETYDEEYVPIVRSFDTSLQDLGVQESIEVHTTLNEAIGVGLANREVEEDTLREEIVALIVLGFTLEEAFTELSRRLQVQIRALLRESVQAGEALAAIEAKIREQFNKAAVSVDRIAKTHVAATVALARQLFYEANGNVVRGVWHRSVFDSRTSHICLARGVLPNVYLLPDYRPLPPTPHPYFPGVPYHPKCRSSMLPWVRSLASLRQQLPRRQRGQLNLLSAEELEALDGERPVPIGLDELITRRRGEELRQVLGAKRYDLYREGKLTFENLIDQRGRPLTLADLERRRSRGAA